MAKRMKQSLKLAFWRMAWLLAATSFLFFAIAEFARQHQAEKAAASHGLQIDESAGHLSVDAVLGLLCISLVCLLLGLRHRRRQVAD